MTDGTSDTDTVNVTDDPLEPSMEDILASIRQLIADDESINSSDDEPQLLETTDSEDVAVAAITASSASGLVSNVSEDTLDLVNPMDADMPNEIDDILSSFSFEDSNSSGRELEIPEIEIDTSDISLDTMASDASEILELSVPEADEDLNSLLSEDLIGNLMGEVVDDNNTDTHETQISNEDDVKIASAGIGDAMLDRSKDSLSSEGLDIDIDELLDGMADFHEDEVLAESVVTGSDMFVANTDTIDFDTDSSDINSILSEIAESLDVPSEEVNAEPVSEDVSFSEIEDFSESNSFEIDSLLEEITGPEISEIQTTDKSISEISDVMASLVDDGDMLLPETESADVNISLADNKMAGITAEVFDFDDSISSEAHDQEKNIDPDIALVKSLMADLAADTKIEDEDEFSSEVTADVSLERDAEDIDKLLRESIGDTPQDMNDIEANESDVLDDLIGSTIESEEQLQADIDSQLSDLSGVLEHQEPEMNTEASPESMDETIAGTMDDTGQSDLTHLANKIDTDDRKLNVTSGVALAGAGVAAAVAATRSTRKSALDSLLDGFEETEDELVAVDVVGTGADDIIPDVSNDETISEDVDDSEALIDDVIAEVLVTAEAEAEFVSTGDDLVDDNGLETELATAELDVIDDILDESTKVQVDTTLENVQETHEIAQMETEDMAGKTARDTILNEVTESETALAFASLNQVVDEKNIVEERGERIGDLVTEALKPMLKEWLDANLKTIVERAVTKEVKRISSGK
ncbi:MAG: DUF2497 domain-containing protein [Maricaulaceae bacterium]